MAEVDERVRENLAPKVEEAEEGGALDPDDYRSRSTGNGRSSSAAVQHRSCSGLTPPLPRVICPERFATGNPSQGIVVAVMVLGTSSTQV